MLCSSKQLENNYFCLLVFNVFASAIVCEALLWFDTIDKSTIFLFMPSGIDEPNLLPNNYYRDDILALWKIMEKFVGSVLRYYYKCDAVSLRCIKNSYSWKLWNLYTMIVYFQMILFRLFFFFFNWTWLVQININSYRII